jgi:hypothetical protein
MPPPSLASLLIVEDSASILDGALQLAQTLGLPVTSWQPGDPTRSLFMLEADTLARLEAEAAGFVGSGFLDFATPGWLVVLAKQVFNVDVPPATFATVQVTLTNAGGGIYVLGPGDVTVKDSSTGTTYHNTDPGTLKGLSSLTINFVADVAGSAGSAGVGEIDSMVTNLLAVTCSNPVAAIGLDQQSAATTILQCRAKLASLSPDGPAEAYEFVARTPALTGINTITRARAYGDNTRGNVTLYVASATGAVGGGDVAAVQAAVLKWATPVCITPTTVSANPVTVNISYTLWVYQSVNQTAAQIQAAVQTALAAMFPTRPIGGDITPPATTGTLDPSIIESAIGGVFPLQTFRVAVTVPTLPLAMANGDVAELGTVTGTINIIPGR